MEEKFEVKRYNLITPARSANIIVDYDSISIEIEGGCNSITLSLDTLYQLIELIKNVE